MWEGTNFRMRKAGNIRGVWDIFPPSGVLGKTVVASFAGSFTRWRWECMACVSCHWSTLLPFTSLELIGGFLPPPCAGKWVTAYLLRLPQRGSPPIHCRRLVRVIVIDGRGCNCFRPGGPMPHAYALDAFVTSKKALRSPCILYRAPWRVLGLLQWLGLL